MREAASVRARLPHHLQVLRRNLETLDRMAAGVAEAQADHAPVAGGSTLRWLLGHLLAYRDHMLVRLGAEPLWDEAQAAPFQRGSTADDAGAATVGPPLSELLTLLRAQQPRLEAAFAAVDEASLATPGPRGTLGEELEFRVWHDTYHIGQAVLYRRAAGLESPIG